MHDLHKQNTHYFYYRPRKNALSNEIDLRGLFEQPGYMAWKAEPDLAARAGYFDECSPLKAASSAAL